MNELPTLPEEFYLHFFAIANPREISKIRKDVKLLFDSIRCHEPYIEKACNDGARTLERDSEFATLWSIMFSNSKQRWYLKHTCESQGFSSLAELHNQLAWMDMTIQNDLFAMSYFQQNVLPFIFGPVDPDLASLVSDYLLGTCFIDTSMPETVRKPDYKTLGDLEHVTNQVQTSYPCVLNGRSYVLQCEAYHLTEFGISIFCKQQSTICTRLHLRKENKHIFSTDWSSKRKDDFYERRFLEKLRNASDCQDEFIQDVMTLFRHMTKVSKVMNGFIETDKVFD